MGLPYDGAETSQTTAELVTDTLSSLLPLFLSPWCETPLPGLRGSESAMVSNPTTVTYLVSAKDMHHLECVWVLVCVCVWVEVMRSPSVINMHCEMDT